MARICSRSLRLRKYLKDRPRSSAFGWRLLSSSAGLTSAHLLMMTEGSDFSSMRASSANVAACFAARSSSVVLPDTYANPLFRSSNP